MKQNDLVTKQEFRSFTEIFAEFKNDIMNRLDDIVGQLETIRQEQIISYGKDKEFEERIIAIENPHS